ncbi:type IV pilus secretin PilQ [Billgrantia endophytica]|uniref:Type IV pilus secretin PilQ n=1 Tax=Billgrantia endophytica TaxID=2033802 RepID=A0A2N7U6U4_9GAMM|nr:type IV pilus secretin family protein [Halomonas endophytica]PMR76145.1 type IV pilus secretin PilQ [Halomonas endophytica]
MKQTIRTVMGFCLLMSGTVALAATALTNLEFHQGASGELQVDLTFSGGVPEVRGYRLDEPARLIIDLVDTGNRLARRRVDLGVGGVQQVTAREAGSRSRLVFDLDEPLPYDATRQDDRLRLSIGGGASPTPVATPSTPHAAPPAVTSRVPMLSTQSGRQSTIGAQPVTRQERNQWVRQQLPYTGERITLNFQDIDVRSALAVIADFTGLNLVASDSVTGRVTLNLQEVPWDQALDLVLKSHGLASRQEGNVLVVASASELANIERQKIEARAQAETLAPLVSEYVEVRYARAEDIARLLRGGDDFGLLTKRGRVAVDQRTNMLLIQDTADQIQEILRTLDRLDVAVRQVQIEARIVIARDSVSRELGVNWGVSSRGSGRVNLGGASSGEPITRDGQRFSQGEYTGQFEGPGGSLFRRGGLAVDLGSVNPMTSFGFGYLSGDVLLDLELRALESENKSQTISQPRVITANQRKATIIQGEERAFQSVDAQGNPDVQFKEAELSLEVTPQITPDDRIIMDLVIKNDSFRQALPGAEPPIDTNRIETQVLVDNGETVVLGGILTTEQLSRLAKTPFFGDLPVLGRLFRYNEQSNQKVELLVFITPRILDDGLAIR